MSAAAVEELLTAGAVVWEGTESGLQPVLTAAGEQAARRMDVEDAPVLLDALEDVSRFVAAHIALTRLTGVRYETCPSWNGLAVKIDVAGTATVDPGQRFALARRWRQWDASDPLPQRLPD